MKTSAIQKKCLKYSSRIEDIQEQVKKLLVGKTVVIRSNFNGQVFGKSKPSKNGVEKKIAAAFVDRAPWDAADGLNKTGVIVRLEGERFFMKLEEVDFV